MLRILHTADWHVGRAFRQFEPEVAAALARDRVAVIDRILGLAEQYDVHAILCAGDLFDSADPGEQWWRAVADVLSRPRHRSRPLIMLPGNHDPLNNHSVYDSGHPFRRALPDWVHVVDCDHFVLELPENGVVHAIPCRSTAGDRDLAQALPARSSDDERIRIGLVHGSTFDLPGYSTNFPISKDAAESRGFDYLAIGDTHSYRDVIAESVVPIVYPGTPEATSFDEKDPGSVAIVSFRRRGYRPTIRKERVGRWKWQDVVVRSVAELRMLAHEDLLSKVLRLRLDFTVAVEELEQVERTLATLRGTEAVSGRAGAFVCNRNDLRVNTTGPLHLGDDLPGAIREVSESLQSEADRDPISKQALLILRRLLHELSSPS